MAKVRGKNTSPEMRVRKFLHAAGFRFRIHRKDLPGTPDVVMPKYHLCIFVHGCFWHQHPGCIRATIPSTRTEFWLRKFQSNKDRDFAVKKKLEELGWNVIVIWECQTKSTEDLKTVLVDRLEKK